MRLARYDEIEKSRYEDYIAEWEAGGGRIVPSASDPKGRGFEEMLAKWRVDESDEAFAQGFVPSTLHFLEDADGRLLGAIHFRHVLNPRLEANGGHIGYGVRPSERRRGYASLMLRMLLEGLRAGGPDRVLLTCDEGNVASARTIEGCGGVLAERALFEGAWTRKYWISLR